MAKNKVKKDVVIWSKKVTLEPERKVFQWSESFANPTFITFKKAFMIIHQDWVDGIDTCAFHVHGRRFRDFSFIHGETLQKLTDNCEVRVYPDGTKFLFVHRNVPTFDSSDLDWDGTIYIAIYRDDEGINMIHCRFGLKVSSFEIYLGLTRSTPELSELLKYIDCGYFKDDPNDKTLEEDEIYQMYLEIKKEHEASQVKKIKKKLEKV